MQQIKRAWNNQDAANKVILISGVALAIFCLVMGKGLYGLVFIVLMFAFMTAHSGQRTKRLRRLYFIEKSRQHLACCRDFLLFKYTMRGFYTDRSDRLSRGRAYLRYGTAAHRRGRTRSRAP